MLDLTWLKEKQLVVPIEENHWRITPVDNIGIEDALQFIKLINASDKMHIADKTSSFARYSRLGLTVTPAYLSTRASTSAKRRRVHPLGLIQYITASMLISGNTFPWPATLWNVPKPGNLISFTAYFASILKSWRICVQYCLWIIVIP